MKNLLLSIALFAFSLGVYAAPFRFVVAPDGTGDYSTIQAAINACPANERSIIFVKNGTYDEQVTLGTKTATSTKYISLIGESYGGVIITHNQSRASSGSPTYEDICTVKLYANDFYAENITIQNTATAGMAEALYTAGDRQTFKNCKVLGYQDTYRAKKGARCYFKNCWMEGAVDFIYAGGTVFLDDCTINCVNGGGYIVAPEDRYVYIPAANTTSGKDLNLEFIFRNCNITANSNVADNTYTLGRPWNVNSGAYYINCKLGSHIKSAGWTTMGGNETTASFAEYNSMDKNGNPINTNSRISWSFQLAKEDVDNLLTPANVYSKIGTVTYDPVTICVSPSKPTISVSANIISWDLVSNVAGYIIYKNGSYLGNTSSGTFTDNSGTTGIYTVKSVNTMGVVSDAASINTGVEKSVDDRGFYFVKNKTVYFSEPVEAVIYNLEGKKISGFKNSTTINLQQLPSEMYVMKYIKSTGDTQISKINL